jgi:hypothetical protein
LLFGCIEIDSVALQCGDAGFKMLSAFTFLQQMQFIQQK